MNKCNVQFNCWGYASTCKFYKLKEEEVKCFSDNGCEYYKSGQCANKKAQIDALKDEGFDIKEGGE